jgi:ABC-type Zn uptake system ZnuABC Zn-binding protein ZnuA
MKRARITPVIAVLLVAGCHASLPKGAHYVTTINPLRAILAEIAGDRGEVTALLTPGASPHTYEPRPSDAIAAESALALFYAADDIDAWAAKLPTKERIALFSFVPEAMRVPYDEAGHAGEDDHHHEQGSDNGHFWSDPVVVKAILPELVNRLSALDPEGAETYKRNAARFSEDLDKLDGEMKTAFAGLGDRPVFMFHPSWTYFMKRYGLRVAGMIEPFPGKEPTPKFLKALIDSAKRQNVRAVFTEPQLPRRPAEVIAEACGLPLHELDPNGGVEGRRTYRELIEYNAAMLKQALQ